MKNLIPFTTASLLAAALCGCLRVEPAAIQPDAVQATAAAAELAPPAEAPPRRGLFGRRAARPELATAAAAAPPVDGVAVVCGAAARMHGKPTDRVAGFGLHDPAPQSVTPRAVRITGFADGCARDVTGAVVLFGQPALYELTRSAEGQRAKSGATDIAYAALKTRVCGGAALCPALQDRAVFITAHDKAGEDQRWVQLLLADGAVLASEVKTR